MALRGEIDLHQMLWEHAEAARQCMGTNISLTEYEVRFLYNMQRTGNPTERQLALLSKLLVKTAC